MFGPTLPSRRSLTKRSLLQNEELHEMDVLREWMLLTLPGRRKAFEPDLDSGLPERVVHGRTVYRRNKKKV